MTETELKQNKLEYIQSFSDEKIISFLNELSNSSLKDKYRGVMDKFVPVNLKHSKQHSKKYGKNTQKKFVSALKGQLNKNEAHLIRIAEQAMLYMFGLWVNTCVEFSLDIRNYILSLDKMEPGKRDQQILNFLIEKGEQEKISKETLQKFYDFSMLPLDSGIEAKINACKTASALFIKNMNENEALKNSLDAEKNTCKKINEKITELQIQLDSLKKYEKTDFTKIKASLEKKLEQKDLEIDSLKTEIEDLKALELKNEKLFDENASLKKYKRNFLANFTSKLGEQEFKKAIIDIILDDSDAGKRIIQKLNLQEELMKNCENYVEDEFIAANLELEKLKKERETIKEEIQHLKEESNEIKNNNIITQIQNLGQKGEGKNYFDDKFENIKKPLYSYNKKMFMDKFLENINLSDEEAINFHNKIEKENFIIIKDNSLIKEWHKACETNITPLNVIPEYDWTSYKDWFGDFIADTFYPSKTLISDYYCYMKNNPEANGIVIFNNFNKIPPEIYLEPFISALDLNGFINIVHPHTELQIHYINLKSIYKIQNLKYVFVESQDKDAFDIPESLSKFKAGY